LTSCGDVGREALAGQEQGRPEAHVAIARTPARRVAKVVQVRLIG
jgi:hypothetical protein